MRGIAIPDVEIVGGKVVPKPRARQKYGNRITKVGDLTFHSAREARRWGDLLMLERAGEISELRRQVPFPLDVNGVRATAYIADFAYRNKAGWLVVEDSKGVETEAFKIKRKLMLAVYGVQV